MLKKKALYFNTLKYLKSIQIFGRIFAEIKKELFAKKILKIRPNLIEQGYLYSKTNFIFHEPWNNRDSVKSNKFTFLGITKSFNNNIEWNISSLPLLWKFNLHYFNYIHLLTKNDQIDLCKNWISNNSFENKVAWHPYVISLRIINLCKANLGDKTINSNLYFQTAYLYRNLEFYHPANHYLENARALIFAGLYFKGQGVSKKWLNKGLEIFSTEAGAQILPDGVYFEKSVMYHAIILEGLLDIINVLPENYEQIKLFRNYALKMLEFLIYSTHPNGSIALLNDSTEEIAPSTHNLIDYAKRINLLTDQKKAVKYFSDSEILTYSDKDLYFIIKGGKIGPDNIPAHAHADIFTFELSYLGEKVIVDSGVFDYQNNEMRKYCRSTAAHNCISIDDKDQAEVWSVFRVGKRYYPQLLELNTEGNIIYKASFNGYSKLIGDGIIQERTFTFDKNSKVLKISDEIVGTGNHQVTSNMHFHPLLDLIQLEENKYKVKSEKVEFNIFTSSNNVIIDKGFYCPKFGEKNDNYHMKLISDVLPCILSYEFHF